MANYRAVFCVGDALVQFLQKSFDNSELKGVYTCTFQLFASPDMTADSGTHEGVVSLYLHRITTNEHFRAVTSLQGHPDEQPVLFLDLHYLITYWESGAGSAGASAQAEQTLLAWTMQQLQTQSILDTSILSLSTAADAKWDLTESIQITPADLSLDDILRIWESFGPKYRLTLAYTARVVRIDRAIIPGLPVVATRFKLQDGVA